MLDIIQKFDQGNKSMEFQPSRLKNNEEAVSAMVNLICEWVNLFAEMQDLVSISTAKAVPKSIASDPMKDMQNW